MTTISIKAKGFGIEIRNEKNLHMKGKYFVIEFEDTYQSRLVDEYGWSEDEADNKVDQVIQSKLNEKGNDYHVHWEDREIFLIEKPMFSIDEMANVLLSVFQTRRLFESKQMD